MTWPKENEWQKQVETGVSEDVLKEVGKRSVEIDKSVVSVVSIVMLPCLHAEFNDSVHWCRLPIPAC